MMFWKLLILTLNQKYKSTKKKETMENMYQRNSNEAFENAKLKGLDKPNEYMYIFFRLAIRNDYQT